MKEHVQVLLLAVVIGIAGCRGGAEKRPELLVPETSLQVVTPVEDTAEATRQRQEQLAEKRDRERAQIQNLGRMLDAAEMRVVNLETELEERLAVKALEWNARAQAELEAIPELDSGEDRK